MIGLILKLILIMIVYSWIMSTWITFIGLRKIRNHLGQPSNNIRLQEWYKFHKVFITKNHILVYIAGCWEEIHTSFWRWNPYLKQNFKRERENRLSVKIKKSKIEKDSLWKLLGANQKPITINKLNCQCLKNNPKTTLATHFYD